jgi:hypothetical protein
LGFDNLKEMYRDEPKTCKVEHKDVQGVRRPIEALDFINPVGRLKDHCCKECIGSKTQITRSYLEVFRKECE